MCCLQVDSVALSYGDQVVLSDVSLTVKKGEVVGLLGRNGCGKSSLLQVLFGVNDRATRHVKVDGNFHMHPFKSGEVFLVPQIGFRINYLTPRKLSKYFEVDEALMLKDHLIASVWNQPFSELSGGETKYVEILAALNSNRNYVLLDEPFSYLAPVMVEQLKEKIMGTCRTKGVLLTDHQFDHVLDVSDRHFIITNGYLRPFSTRADLVALGFIT